MAVELCSERNVLLYRLDSNTHLITWYSIWHDGNIPPLDFGDPISLITNSLDRDGSYLAFAYWWALGLLVVCLSNSSVESRFIIDELPRDSAAESAVA